VALTRAIPFLLGTSYGRGDWRRVKRARLPLLKLQTASTARRESDDNFSRIRVAFYAGLDSIAAAASEHGARGAVRAEIVDAVDGEKIGQPGTGAIDAALDRADRASADRRRVVVRKA
jgi:hypothetical protein